jgi:hypothetical protein
MNSNRVFGEHSITCSLVQNSGFMLLILAMSQVPIHLDDALDSFIDARNPALVTPPDGFSGDPVWPAL